MYTPLDNHTDLCGKTISHVFETGYDEVVLLTQDMHACKFYVDDGELDFRGMSDHSLRSYLSGPQQVLAGLLSEKEHLEKEAAKMRAIELNGRQSRLAQYLKLKAEFEVGPTQGNLF